MLMLLSDRIEFFSMAPNSHPMYVNDLSYLVVSIPPQTVEEVIKYFNSIQLANNMSGTLRAALWMESIHVIHMLTRLQVHQNDQPANAILPNRSFNLKCNVRTGVSKL